MLESLGKTDMIFSLTALVRGDETQGFSKDKSPAFYSSRELGLLAKKLDAVEVCFMIGGLGGDSCQYMPELARELRKLDIMTVALVTFPFRFENLAEKAGADLRELEDSFDALLVFENDSLSRDQGSEKSLAVALEDLARAMLYCLKAMTAREYDVADLRASLHGRTYYGIGHSDENLMQALRNATAALKKEFPSNFRIASGMAAFRGANITQLIEGGGEIGRLLDADNASWLVSFDSAGPENGGSVTLLACG